MNKTNFDIWTTVHWWGWKIHVNQAGWDLLNDKLTTLSYSLNLRTRFYFRNSMHGWWTQLVMWFIFLIINKIITFKFKACNTNNQKWCENILDCNDKCQPIKIKEITINFLWLPVPFIPIKKRIIK